MHAPMNDVTAAFDRGAANYDRLVSLNPGYHRHLRDAAAELIGRVTRSRDRLRLLDLACGSGCSTQALSSLAPQARIVGIDQSPGMLEQARRKAWPEGVEFRSGSAGHLNVQRLGATEWDGIFASYLFRNVPAAQRDTAISEAHGLLAPGGWLVTQEYSVKGNAPAQAVWDAVAWGVIVPLGALVDRNPGLYRYLWRSVRAFDSTGEFMRRLAQAGFVDIACRTVGGWQRGILHTFVARKPE